MEIQPLSLLCYGDKLTVLHEHEKDETVDLVTAAPMAQ